MAYFYTTKKHLDELTGVVEVTSEHTLAEPNQYVVATSGTFDINLPDSSNPGDEFVIKNIGSGIVTVTGGLNKPGTDDPAATPFNMGSATMYGICEDVVSGGYIVGGSWTANDADEGRPYQHIFRLNDDLSVDSSFNPTVNSAVHRIFNDGTGYIITGLFTTVGGVARTNIARINNNGTLDAGWVPPTLDSIVWGLLDIGTGYIASGFFTSVNSDSSYSYLCKLNYDGSHDGSFIPPVFDNIVYECVQDGTGYIIVGRFTLADASSRLYLCRISSDGTLDAGWTPPVLDNWARNIVVSGTDYFVGGDFTAVNSDSTYGSIFKMSSAGAVNASFQAGVDGTVYDINVNDNGSVYVYGSMTVGSQSPSHLQKLLSDGSVDNRFLQRYQAFGYQMIVDSSGKTVCAPNSGGMLYRIHGEVASAGKQVDGEANDFVLSIGDYLHIRYVNSTYGWTKVSSSRKKIVDALTTVEIIPSDNVMCVDNTAVATEPDIYLYPAHAAGTQITVKNVSSGSIEVYPNGSDTIDGESVLEVSAGASVDLLDTGSEWIVI